MFNKLLGSKKKKEEEKARSEQIARVEFLVNRVLDIFSTEKVNFYEIFDVLLNVQAKVYPQVSATLRTNFIKIKEQVEEINDLRGQIYVKSQSEDNTNEENKG